MKCGTKKMAAGGGIREGKARFGDDVRERAKKKIAEQMAKAENKSKFGGKEPSATPKSKPVAKKPAPAAKPAAKPAISANSFGETASESARRAPRPSAPASRPKLKPQPGGVGMLGMFGVEDPRSGTINEDKRDKPTMAKGGSVAKRADGVVKRGKTKGRMI